MHPTRWSWWPLLIVILLAAGAARARWPFGSARNSYNDDSRSDRMPMRDVQTLTLRAGQYTTGRRSSGVPQLVCLSEGGLGAAARPKVVQCANKGVDDRGQVQWRCEADLPAEARFGHIEVVCEGYERPGDTDILKGSCSLEYTLEKRTADPKIMTVQDQGGTITYLKDIPSQFSAGWPFTVDEESRDAPKPKPKPKAKSSSVEDTMVIAIVGVVGAMTVVVVFVLVGAAMMHDSDKRWMNQARADARAMEQELSEWEEWEQEEEEEEEDEASRPPAESPEASVAKEENPTPKPETEEAEPQPQPKTKPKKKKKKQKRRPSPRERRQQQQPRRQHHHHHHHHHQHDRPESGGGSDGPGFWDGALLGGLTGYAWGNSGTSSSSRPSSSSSSWGGGSSSSSSRPSFSSSSSGSGSSHRAVGFGGSRTR